MSSINQKEVSNLAEELRTITAHAQVLLSKIAMNDQGAKVGDTPEARYPHDYEPLTINGQSDFGTQKMHHIQRPYIGLQAPENMHASVNPLTEVTQANSYVQNSGHHQGFTINDGSKIPSIRPHILLNHSPDYENPGFSYQYTRQDPSGIYYCPHTCNEPTVIYRNEPCDWDPSFGNSNTINEGSCIAPSFIHTRNSINHSCRTYEDNSRKVTPQEPLNNHSVQTATTLACSYAFQSYNNNNQDPTLNYASKASNENDMNVFGNSSEWNLDALYGVPTMDEFQECYTTDDLPKYAVVLGSTVSSHNSRDASRAYRIARGTNNTSLAVVYERLLSHFRIKGSTTYENKFPQNTDQLLFVRVLKGSDPKNTKMKFEPLSDRSTRDDRVLADIRSNGNRLEIDILKTLIDQKRRDLDTLNPAPPMSTKFIFMNHLISIETLIKTEQDEMSLMQCKMSIETMWDQFFTLDKCPKKRGRPSMRPSKDCSVIIDGKGCNDPRNTIRIIIELLTGGEIYLFVEPTDTVAVVKAKLSMTEGFPSDDQILSTKGVQMKNSHTLDQYSVSNDSVLQLHLHIRGGADDELVTCSSNGSSESGCRSCLNSDVDDCYTNSFQATSDQVFSSSCAIETVGASSCKTEVRADMFLGKIIGYSNENKVNIVQTPLSCVLPNDPNFTPSVNGRAGWSYDKIYELQHGLGRGAFGEVYMASHRMASSDTVPWKNVAVKHFRPNLLDLREGRVIRTYDDIEKYCDEIKVLIHLREGSPEMSHVLYLYEFFLDVREVFAVTELLDQSLEVWKQECKGFTEQMAIDICRSILLSLNFISERNVVHRDIKPENVLFRSVGDFKSLKLVDFGLSRILGEHEEVRDFCGSVGYIAPEVYAGQSYRFEVDMFAFGVLLFRLLSGKAPFPKANSQMLRRHTLEYRYNISGTAWDNVSYLAKDLVRRLLINSHDRLSAQDALAHPWFTASPSEIKAILYKSSRRLEVQNCNCSVLDHKNELRADIHDIECRAFLVTAVDPPETKSTVRKTTVHMSSKDPPETKPSSFLKTNEVSFLEKRSIVRGRDENDGRSMLGSILKLFQNRGTVDLKPPSTESTATSTQSSLDDSADASQIANAIALPMSCFLGTTAEPTSHHNSIPVGRSILRRMVDSIIKMK